MYHGAKSSLKVILVAAKAIFKIAIRSPVNLILVANGDRISYSLVRQI
jgi:hypothetical protein